MNLLSQIESESATSNDTLSYIAMEADTAIHIGNENNQIDTLYGNVLLNQDSLFMYCDRAIVIDQLYASAYHNVIIIHHDTIHIFADSMKYDGARKISDLYGEVILQDGGRRLYTTELTYDVQNKQAWYTNGGTLIDGIDTIVSKEGYYYKSDQLVKLKGNVSFRDTSKILKTDSIDYLYDLDQLNIVAPTRIAQDSLEIYSEDGMYRLEQDRGILSRNVQVRSGQQLIASELLDINGKERKYTFLISPRIEDDEGIGRGDTIVYFDQGGQLEIRTNASYTTASENLNAPIILYDKDSGKYTTKGRARIVEGENSVEADSISGDEAVGTILIGQVVINDYEKGVKILSESAIKKDDDTKVFGVLEQPLLTYRMKDDSLLLRADTLHSSTVNSAASDTSVQLLFAHKRVRLRSGSTSGVSDQFEFNQVDSVICLWGNPVLWSDSIQLSGDTIRIYILNNEVNRITLHQNAFIVAPDSLGMQNQMKGHMIENFIQDKKVEKSIITGNAELFYLIEDEGKYEGINLTKSSEMIFTFRDSEIASIKMTGVPESNIYQYNDQLVMEDYFLDGFRWRIKERPGPELFIVKK